MRVLLIDDDEDLRNLLSRYIRAQWADAEIEAYDPLERDLPGAEFPLGSYDVLVLDYMLGPRRRPGVAEDPQAAHRLPQGPVPHRRRQRDHRGARDEGRRRRLPAQAGADAREADRLAARADRRITVERTVSPDLASRMEGHALGGKVRIPGIKVLHLIGEGGTARVYLASREDDDEPLVVKILRHEIVTNKKALERFMEEYAMVERIQSRHVARIVGHGNYDNYAYLVMEFFEGGDLNKRLGRQGGAAAGGVAVFPRADVRARRHPREGHPAPRPEAAEPDVPPRRQPGDRRLRHRQEHRRRRPHQRRRDARHAALHEPGAGAGAGARPAHRHLQRRRAAATRC